MGSHGKWDDYDIAFMIMVTVKHIMHYNLKFGLATKVKAYKGASQNKAWESHLMLLGM
jgi:hypothetical protein